MYLFKSLLDLVPFPSLSVLFSGSLGTRRTGEGVFLKKNENNTLMITIEVVFMRDK